MVDWFVSWLVGVTSMMLLLLLLYIDDAILALTFKDNECSIS